MAEMSDVMGEKRERKRRKRRPGRRRGTAQTTEVPKWQKRRGTRLLFIRRGQVPGYPRMTHCLSSPKSTTVAKGKKGVPLAAASSR